MTTTASLLLAVCSGCGGLSGSKSVSPGNFLIPGLMKNEVRPGQIETLEPVSQPATSLASLR